MTFSTEIALRRDTAINWTINNPTLVQGEPGLETDTGNLKLGDGTSAWNSLGYHSVPISKLAGQVIYSSGWPARPTGYALVEWTGPIAHPPYVYRTFGSATISSTTNITATGAAFTTADIGAPITGVGITAGTTILSVTDSTHAVLSQPCVNASGLTVVIAPNGMRENDKADLI